MARALNAGDGFGLFELYLESLKANPEKCRKVTEPMRRYAGDPLPDGVMAIDPADAERSARALSLKERCRDCRRCEMWKR